MKDIKEWVKDLPERKKYIDVVTAIMSVPILLTVMLTNITNLTHKNDTSAASHVENKPSPTISEIIKIVPIEVHTGNSAPSNSDLTNTPTPTLEENKNINLAANPTSTPACKKEVGPVSIVSPSENETMSINPTCIDISYKSGEYCGVTWSYRIDGGSWSEYMDKSICIHNINNGTHKLELKIKSTASADETVLTRNFTYAGQNVVTATPTIAPTNTPEPTASVSTSSATTN